MDPDAVLYSFDIADASPQYAQTIAERDNRLRFKQKSQDALTAEDIDGREIDFAFFDASHDLEINQRTFAGIESLLARRAIIAVHDTGAWSAESVQLSLKAGIYSRENPSHWVSPDEFAHRPDERRFVNWVAETRPDFNQIHLHSATTLRHGLTLLQAGGPLSS
jgi:hypothetical protein